MSILNFIFGIIVLFVVTCWIIAYLGFKYGITSDNEKKNKQTGDKKNGNKNN